MILKINKGYIMIWVVIIADILLIISSITFLLEGNFTFVLGVIMGFCQLLSFDKERKWYETPQKVFLVGKKHDEIVNVYQDSTDVILYLSNQEVDYDVEILYEKLDTLILGQQVKVGEYYIQRSKSKPKDRF